MLISVPATSANLGPGFDVLGLALQLYNRFEVSLSEDLIIEGTDPQYCNESNLFYQAYKKGIEKIGVNDSIHVIFHCDIPISRGLGSSASLIIGGLKAASALHNNALSDDDILELATQIEGHPDNVAPALFGGMTACLNESGLLCLKSTPAENLFFTVFIPDYEVSTEKARAILPKTLSVSDAVYNISHALLLFEGLRNGDREMIFKSAHDRIHEPYRKTLIPDYDRLAEKVYSSGAMAFLISGSGSTTMAISDKELAVDTAGLKNSYQILSLKVHNGGVTVC